MSALQPEAAAAALEELMRIPWELALVSRLDRGDASTEALPRELVFASAARGERRYLIAEPLRPEPEPVRTYATPPQHSIQRCI